MTIEQIMQQIYKVEQARDRFTLDTLKRWYKEAVQGRGSYHDTCKTDKVKIEFYVEALDEPYAIVFIHFTKLFGTREVITHKAWNRKELMQIDSIGLLDSIAFSDYETFLRVIA